MIFILRSIMAEFAPKFDPNGEMLSRNYSDDVTSLDSWSEATGSPTFLSNSINSTRESSPRMESDPIILNPMHLEHATNRQMRDIIAHSDHVRLKSYHSQNDNHTIRGNDSLARQTIRNPYDEQANFETLFTQNYVLRQDNPHIRNHGHEQSRNISAMSPLQSNEHLVGEFGTDINQLLEQREKVKTKLMSVWNNVRYGWTIKMKTNFKYDSPIFLLGKCYHIRYDEDNVQPGNKVLSPPTMELFRQDFTTRLWFTYRREFPAISGTKLTTDCGWGCMLRSGQMMLAQALICHFLGKGSRQDMSILSWEENQVAAGNLPSPDSYGQLRLTEQMNKQHRRIIQWFSDDPGRAHPFSIHQLVKLGIRIGKQPGDWYGPASVAFILSDALKKTRVHFPELQDVCLYVAQDCTVYKEDILEMCCQPLDENNKSQKKSENWHQSSGKPLQSASPDTRTWQRAVVILIPVRLGGEVLNPIYNPCVKSLLAQDYCIGIIGGRPKHSLYFVGWQDEKLIHLDPHLCQDVVDTYQAGFPIQSFHCLSPRKMSIENMDPSCSVGFYCRTQEEFYKFVQITEEMVAPPKQRGQYPMFIFSDGKCSDFDLENLSLEQDRYLRVRHLDESGHLQSTTESEDFVVL